MSKKLTKDEFVARSNVIHNNKYDYNDVEYVNSKVKVKIKCPKHGIFEQIPNSHLNGIGCPICSNLKKSENSRDSLSNVIKKFRKIHGDKYDYSLVEYVNSGVRVKIICSEHGIFEQRPSCHLGGQGCRECSIISNTNKKRTTNDEFIKKAKKVHGETYNYDKTIYLGNDKKVNVMCPKHGEFYQEANSHLQGHGCKKCSIIRRSDKHRLTKDEFIIRSNKVHNNKYDYGDVEYIDNRSKVKIRCPKHGIFLQNPNDHLNGSGCNECKKEKLSLSIDEFITRSNNIHNNKYDYSLVEYKNSYTDVKIICHKHGEFKQSPHSHLKGHGCRKCSRTISRGEKELIKYVKSIVNDNVIENTKKIISPREIDCYVPNKKIGIEYCGLYWHSEKFKDIDYHLNKLKLCKERGIDLITIFEDEWIYKKDIVKRILKDKLGCGDEKINAKNCVIKKIDLKSFELFLDNNHIQGSVGCDIRYGLFSSDVLVGVMGFVEENESWDLKRFATSINVVDGFSKMLKVFISEHDDNIFTFVDLRFLNEKSNLCEKNGFIKKYVTKPDYYYVKDLNRYNKINFQKHKLNKMLDKYDENLTDNENIRSNRYLKIHDCGEIKYIYKN